MSNEKPELKTILHPDSPREPISAHELGKWLFLTPLLVVFGPSLILSLFALLLGTDPGATFIGVVLFMLLVGWPATPLAYIVSMLIGLIILMVSDNSGPHSGAKPEDVARDIEFPGRWGK